MGVGGGKALMERPLKERNYFATSLKDDKGLSPVLPTGKFSLAIQKNGVVVVKL